MSEHLEPALTGSETPEILGEVNPNDQLAVEVATTNGSAHPSDGNRPVVAQPEPDEPLKPRRRFSLGVDRFSGLYLWGVFIIVFGIWTPHLFLTLGTLHSVASEQAITAIMALGILIPFAAGVFDLSIGATANLAAIVATVLQSNRGWGVWPSIIVALVTCVIIGIVNGVLVVKFHISSFIATLGMASVVSAIQVIISGSGQPAPPTSSLWTSLTQSTVFGFQVVVVYLVVIALVIWWVLEHTPAGRYFRAVGGNLEAARLSGVAVDKWTWRSLVISSSLAGVAGVLFASLSGPSLTFGAGLLLPAFAAAFLGSTQLRPGRFNVWGTMIAVYVLATGIQGLQLVTSAQWLGDMFDGVALILAVGVAVWRQREAKRRA